MVLPIGLRLPHCPRSVISLSSQVLELKVSFNCFVASLHKVGFANSGTCHAKLPFGQVKWPTTIDYHNRVDWSIRNSADGKRSDPLSNSGDGRTRLIKTVENIQIRLNAKIKELRKGLARKLFFFLVGFYCATAFATVIGQTGDWDILSAALAAAVVEGIGALMYKVSIPLLDRFRNLIVMFNYWKAGLTLGLFLDSFKY